MASRTLPAWRYPLDQIRCMAPHQNACSDFPSGHHAPAFSRLSLPSEIELKRNLHEPRENAGTIPRAELFPGEGNWRQRMMTPLVGAGANQFRKQIKRAAQKQLSFLAIPARKISRFLDDSERTVHQGYRIPPRRLRQFIGGDVFGCDDFYLQSTIVEAAKFSTTLGYTKSSRVVEVGCGCGRSATGLLAEFGDVDYFGLAGC
jgi:hypothetical protein